MKVKQKWKICGKAQMDEPNEDRCGKERKNKDRNDRL
jgi:hypothetical protein